MDAEIVGQFIPMVATVVVFAMPVCIVFLVKHFKYKQLELDAELAARKMLSDRDRVELEKRIERLETIVMGARAAGPAPLLPAISSSALYEPPPSIPSEPAAQPIAPREKA